MSNEIICARYLSLGTSHIKISHTVCVRVKEIVSTVGGLWRKTYVADIENWNGYLMDKKILFAKCTDL